MANIKIPKRFQDKLNESHLYDGVIKDVAYRFGQILEENNLYFFEEYTDHGIRHIESVLEASEYIIEENTWNILDSKNCAVLILSIFLHDLGMHLSFASFKALLEEEEVLIKDLDVHTWKELWIEYLSEVKKFNSKQNIAVFGNINNSFSEPDLSNKDSLTGYHRKLIGEFIRRNHPRIAHEIAIGGLIGSDGKQMPFIENSSIDESFKKIVGIVSRSHGTSIRTTYKYLRTLSTKEFARPYNIHIIFLMAILRIADYFQFTRERLKEFSLKFKTFTCPISEIEHQQHLSIKFVKESSNDPETLYVEAMPSSSFMYVKLRELFNDIQNELDLSWASIGEFYGKENLMAQPKLKVRRIISNIDDSDSFQDQVNYIADKISLKTDIDLPKLLIAPLYGNKPIFGVRELIQNAVDACHERNFLEQRAGKNYIPQIIISLFQNKGKYFFSIEDNGKGMSVQEIKNYFLTTGASFRRSLEWQKSFKDEDKKSLIHRSGKFGIGALAGFLLGDDILVETKSYNIEFSAVSFRYNLDVSLIELNKIERQIGTKITIAISKDFFMDLKSKDYNDELQLFEWFYLKTPNIKFLINGIEEKTTNQVLPSFNEQLPDTWHSFEDAEYAKIHWSYEGPRRKYSKPDRAHKVFVNGIYISEGVITDREDKKIFTTYPSVNIFDYEGNAPLKLDRTGFDEELGFVKKLNEVIHNDILAMVLNGNYSGNIQEGDLRFFHKAHLTDYGLYANAGRYNYNPLNESNIWFCKEGYTINLPTIVNKSKHEYLTYVFVRSFGNAAVIELLNEFLSLGKLISIVLINDYNEASTRAIFDYGFSEDQTGFRILLPKPQYEYFFHPLKTKVRKDLKEKHTILYTSSAWVCFSYGTKVAFDYPKIEDIPNSIIGIAEIPIKFINNYNKRDLYPEIGKLTELYFPESIIPYHLELRKEKFSNAFLELGPYMRKYIGNGNTLTAFPFFKRSKKHR